MLYARTQDEIYTNVRNRSRSAPSRRWTDEEVYNAINSALDTWDNRVIIPHVYAITWVTDARDYTLPSYIKKFVSPQYLHLGDDSWHNLAAYRTHPGPDGNLTLHLPYYPTPGSGRVEYWTNNSRLPVESPDLSVAIDADDTSLTVDDEVLVDECGYIRIGNEWIGYSGLTLGDSSLTLLNLERGSLDTIAASHVEGDPVLWGVVAQRTDLYPILEMQAMVYLHELMLTDGSAKETETHERVMNWHQTRVDRYWATSYAPPRGPRFVLSPAGIGGPLDNSGRVFPAGGDRTSFP